LKDPAPRLKRLVPAGADALLSGCFLGHRLHRRGASGKPFVYTNFIVSLDGRISWKNPQDVREVPPACSNAHDQRLYHELAAQADILLTSARHLHAAAAGRGTDMLTLGADAAELTAWRQMNGLTPGPRVAAVSAKLDLPPRERLPGIAGEITVLTWGSSEAGRLAEARARGYDVRVCGEGPDIDGHQLLAALAPCKVVCSVAGPKVHSALLRAGRMDRIYLTLVPLLLGGEVFDTLTTGAPLCPPPCFGLSELWHDELEPKGCGQLFAVFDAAARADQPAQK
jgi:riboflavin biosynthesis pyrimidine reductase